MVSHICLLVELGPICNSMAASLCLKSCEDHVAYLKVIIDVYGKTITGLGPTNKNDQQKESPHLNAQWNEPQHEISNNVVCTTSKGSDQSAHMHSLVVAWIFFEC